VYLFIEIWHSLCTPHYRTRTKIIAVRATWVGFRLQKRIRIRETILLVKMTCKALKSDKLTEKESLIMIPYFENQNANQAAVVGFQFWINIQNCETKKVVRICFWAVFVHSILCTQGGTQNTAISLYFLANITITPF
jgi:hypothetical protein